MGGSWSRIVFCIDALVDIPSAQRKLSVDAWPNIQQTFKAFGPKT